MAENFKHLSEKNWAPRTYQALCDVIATYGMQSSSYNPDKPPYVVFDFDNTSAIMDIEDLLMLYMMLHLNYKLTPEQFHAVLTDGIAAGIAAFDDLLDQNNSKATIRNITDDITSDYTWLYHHYEGFGQGGTESLEETQESLQYQDFAAKLRLFLHGHQRQIQA